MRLLCKLGFHKYHGYGSTAPWEKFKNHKSVKVVGDMWHWNYCIHCGHIKWIMPSFDWRNPKPSPSHNKEQNKND